jgi:phytoene synthase
MNTEETGVIDKASSAMGRAGGSSFYFAMRMLPREQRESMFEVYSFCRAVDDIADSNEPRPVRLKRLEEWRQNISALYAGHVPQGLAALARAKTCFSLQKKDFLAVIEGMEMDSVEDIRAPDLEQLHLYCDRVACAVGRLSVRIFGMEDHDGELLAHHLGTALQLTNILRDIDEDAGEGRLYLPREALELAGIRTTDPKLAVSDSKVDVACKFVAEEASKHFMKSEEILARSPRRTARVPKIMKAVYLRMLEKMIVRGWSQPRVHVRLSRPQLLRIALRHAIA